MNTISNKNNKIEPHVILHLRINQDDINRYLNNKIQTDPSDINKDIVEPTPYEQCNINTMTDTFTLNDPTPSNLEDDQFTNFNIVNKDIEFENSSNNIVSNNIKLGEIKKQCILYELPSLNNIENQLKFFPSYIKSTSGPSITSTPV